MQDHKKTEINRCKMGFLFTEKGFQLKISSENNFNFSAINQRIEDLDSG